MFCFLCVFMLSLMAVLSCVSGSPAAKFDIRGYSFDKGVQFVKLNKRVEEGQIVFVGDSITDHGQLDKYYDLPLHIYTRGIGADTVNGLTGRMDISVYNLKPKLVIFLMGINDLYQGRTNEELYESWNEALQGISDELPDAKVLVLSGYPIDTVNEDGSDADINIMIR